MRTGEVGDVPARRYRHAGRTRFAAPDVTSTSPFARRSRLWAPPSPGRSYPSLAMRRGEGTPDKTHLDFGRQLALRTRHRLPERDLVLVALQPLPVEAPPACPQARGLTVIARPRLDVALPRSGDATARQTARVGRVRDTDWPHTQPCGATAACPLCPPDAH